MPKVSIIVPVYNVDKYLPECLNSLLVQTYGDIEIICINDGSADNSSKILEDFSKKDSRIIVIEQKNQGVSCARNNGIKIAKGQYLMFVDADDWVEPEFAETALAKIEHLKADFVCFMRRECYNEKSSIFDTNIEIAKQYQNEKTKDLDIIINFAHFVTDKIFSKDFLDRNNISFPEKIKTCEDGIFNLYCILNGATFGFVPDVLYNYRLSRKGRACLNKKDIVLNDIKAVKYFLNTDMFKNASYQEQIFCLEKMLCGILLYYKAASTFYQLYYLLQIKNLKKFLEQKLSNKLKDNSDAYKEIMSLSFEKSLVKGIFSIENEWENRVKIKVVSILFFKLRIKTSSKDYKKLLKSKITPESVVIIEANDCHGETIPGYTKYLSDLGYKVDLIILDCVNNENPFVRTDRNLYNNKYVLNPFDIGKFLSSSKICDYKFALINSYYLYYNNSPLNPISFFEAFKNIKSPKNGYIFAEHHLDKVNETLLKEGRVLQLANLSLNDKLSPVFCNPNYFGKVKNHTKNKITKFISAGGMFSYRRDINILFDVVQNLVNSGIKNFKIVLCGTKRYMIIPEELLPYFEFKGRLSFENMFEEVETSDFYLPLLNPQNQFHDRYTKDGTSGSFQLIYGFNIPAVINSKFAEYHFLNDKNSVIYNENSELTESMKRCINMKNEEYDNMRLNLSKTAESIRKQSLNNLKSVINNIEQGQYDNERS